jgi:hypothetical protein
MGLRGLGVGLARMGMSRGLGGGMVASWATTGAGLGESEARTLSSTTGCLGGRGMAETMEAWMEPATGFWSPQVLPWGWRKDAPIRAASAAAWSAMARVKSTPMPVSPGLRWRVQLAAGFGLAGRVDMIGLLGRLLFQGLGDDADVGDAGLLDGVHDGGEGSEGDALVGAEIDDLPAGVFVGLEAGAEELGELVDVDGLVLTVGLKEDVLGLVDGDDDALFGELGDGAGVGNRDFDPGLEDRGGEHEDEQEDEDDVDQRGDVDVGEGGLGAEAVAGAGGEGHG